ncbi:MAG: hypothetical protein SFX73_23315 [Kofleriaceae bacterium]|nr:hypothetical protein [Kofleriaceae bacterium]
MRRFVLASILAAAACGGPQIPTHNGYKSEKVKPWKKPKTLVWDEKGETKADGELSYPDMRRARWYAFELPAPGEVSLKLEVNPPGDAVNEDFDLAMEVLDPGYRVISKADAEEEDVGELTKTRNLLDLQPGNYLVHIYLQGRMDSADYVLRASYKRAGSTDVKSDFPAQVAFLPALPMVPLNDDTPAKYKPPTSTPVVVKKPSGGGGSPKKPPPPKEEPAAPPATTKTARIIATSVSGGGTQITIGMGTAQGVASGWKAKIAGVQGTFPLNCDERKCTASVSATADQVKAGGGTVTLSP